MVVRLGQLAFKRCLAPSGPILFESKDIIGWLPNLMVVRLGHLVFDRYLAPSGPILFES